MLQMLLALVQLLVVGVLTITSIVFAIIAIVRWRQKRRAGIFAGIAAAAVILAMAVWSFDLFSSESTDRAELAEAFHSNFGFDPPEVVKEIKVKNIFIYDASGHWMAFTYDPQVLERIVAHDQHLQIAKAGTREFNVIVKDAFLKNQNRPDWAVSPDGRTSSILFKENFLEHNSSEYYLWVDSAEAMVHLHVSYFD